MKLLLLVTNVLAYNWNVHGYLGDLLHSSLPSSTVSKLLFVLNGTTLNDASIWADKVKKTKKYSFSRPLHYMDIIDKCSITRKDINCNDNKCIYYAIHQLTSSVDRGPFEGLTKVERLKFLLHFLQDITQPLHVYGKFRGGNDVKVTRNKNGRNKTTNLHTLWDSEIPQTFISSGKYQHTIKNVTLVDVINFNLNVGCNYAYNFKDDYIIFEDYYMSDVVKEMFDNYISLALSYL